MKRLIFIIAFMLLPSCGWGADHYVRQPGTTYGTSSGNDWTNAYTGIPATLVRGDTYYIAGGTYNSRITFQDTESGNIYIYIKKANATDNSGVAGWSSVFASDVALFSGPDDLIYGACWTMKRGYYSFDGVTGSGQSGHGFKCTYSGVNQDHFMVHIRDNAINGVIIKHVEFALPGASDDFTQFVFARVNGSMDNWVVSYIYAHDFQIITRWDSCDRVGYPACSDPSLIVENSYFKNNWSSPLHHGVLMNLNTADNIIFRNNIAENACNGTGGIIAYPGYSDVKNVKIYNNIFFNSGASGNGLFGVGNGATPPEMKNWDIYNNIIDNQSGKLYTGDPGVRIASNIIMKNNLFINAEATINADANEYIAGNNYYNNTTGTPLGQSGAVYSSEATSSLFTNYVGHDYTFVSGSQAIDIGASLPSPYNVDVLGYSRPFGVYFDAGAYEYGASGSGPTIGGVPSKPIIRRLFHK